ncbi:MAG: cyclic nucleotide-binding domain-containing protein [Acidobacteria bacterium]|nr:MAG: cyclic nucleotide-binding domain-containing protein [Acidobacteriota bacterium]
MTADDTRKLDDISFLRETALFRDMPESVIQTIVSQGQTLSFGTGQLVVKKKTAGDSLFIVKSGVVEVVNPAEGAPLAYLGRGESFGEMALLTNSERSADVRVPQDAELLVIDRALFDDLMTNHSGFAAQMAVILARRLVAVLEDLPDREMKRELQGDLAYFDLATVIQTLISASQSGVMTLSIDKTMVAQIFFQSGNICRAYYGHRRGDEAVHHLFQALPGGKFLFESRADDAVTDGPDPGITVPAMALMMDSVRLQDELKMILEELPADNTLLERNADKLVWTEDEGQADARQIWASLQAPVSLGDLFDRSHACHYHTASIIAGLLQTEQIKPALG